MRVDDDGNEMPVVLKDHENTTDIHKPTKQEILAMIDGMIDNIERLPPEAMSQAINHYDFVSALLLFSSLFKASD